MITPSETLQQASGTLDPDAGLRADYCFEASATSRYLFSTCPPEGTASYDTNLAILRMDGTPVVFAQGTSQCNYRARLEWTATDSAVFRARVSSTAFFGLTYALGYQDTTPGQTVAFAYVNQEDQNGNRVALYAVDAAGRSSRALDAPTGGRGGASFNESSALRDIILSGNCLYATNGGSDSVASFIVDPTTGGLTPAAGSPYATGARADYSMGLAVDMTGSFVYALSNSTKAISTFVGGDGCTLSLSRPITPELVFGSSIETSPLTGLLVVSLPNPNLNAMSAYTIDPDTGRPTSLAGSPFAVRNFANGALDGLSFHPALGMLYAAESNQVGTVINLFDVSMLTPVETDDSPYIPGRGGVGSTIAQVSPLGDCMLVSNTGSLTAFTVDPGGAIAATAGSPYAIPAGSGSAGGIAFSPDGTLAFVSTSFGRVALYRIDACEPTLLGYFSARQSGSSAVAFFPMP